MILMYYKRLTVMPRSRTSCLQYDRVHGLLDPGPYRLFSEHVHAGVLQQFVQPREVRMQPLLQRCSRVHVAPLSCLHLFLASWYFTIVAQIRQHKHLPGA